ILIISMHVHNLGMESIYSYSLVNGLFRYAVPFFFIVNGYFLITSIEKSGFYTWVKRVIILYTLWMIIYLPIYYKQFDIHTSTGKLDLAITMLLGFHHLWYLVAMFVGGVLLFLTRKSNMNVMLAISFALIICGVLIQYYLKIHGKQLTQDRYILINLYRNFLFMGFPFMFIGHYLRTQKIEINQKIAISIAALSAFCVIFESIYYYSIGDILPIDTLFSVSILAPALFLIAKNINIKKSVKSMSTIATAVYLTHPFIIKIVSSDRFGISESMYTIFLLSSVFSILLAIILSKMNKKFKYLL
ncbi:TPA: acyltransferase family protein, partial [Serratia marcescens]